MAFKSLTVQMKILLHPIIYRMDTKILLYSTENFIQYPVTTIMERNMKNVHIYIYISESLCCRAEINTTL